MTSILQPPSLDLKSLDLGLRFPNQGVLCDLWFSWYSQKCHCPVYLTAEIRSVFHLFLPPTIFLSFCVRLRLLSSFDFSAPEHMREKRLVTFRMAPKKSKRQMSEKEVTMADGWKKSKLSEAVISSLVSLCLLQSRTLIQWQPAEGHGRPSEKTSEIVLFKAFVECGLAIPACDFLRGLLFFCGV